MVKQALGVMIAAPPVVGDMRMARRVRVYCTIVDAIRTGALPVGTRLPSARQLAAEWGYARGAVEDAFAQLQIEGLIERRVGDGSYVAARAASAAPPEQGPANARPLSRSAQRVLNRFAAYFGKPRQQEVPQPMLSQQPLYPRAPLLQEFPLDVWRRLIARAHGEHFRDHLAYGPSAGLPRLREAIARHLSLARATPVKPQQVVVVHSATQAFELLVNVLLEPGDRVWLEDPGHGGLISLFQVLGIQVVGVPLDAQGLNVEAGQAMAPDAALAYIHPIAQYPTGVRMSPGRRNELLKWADASGAWIVEGNFNDEITYGRQSPGALWSMDDSDRVLMLGTMEGIMFPSLRVAYLVVPTHLVDAFVAMRGMLNDSTNTQLQLALAWFIEEGHLAAHVRHLRQLGLERRAALKAACERHLPAWARLGPLEGGFVASISVPFDLPDRQVVRRMRERGIVAAAMSSSCIDPQHGNGLVIGYGAFDAFTIERSIALIAQCLAETAAEAGYQRAGENM